MDESWACVSCGKEITFVKIVKCTNCKAVYCSAKCKKESYKIHKKSCKFEADFFPRTNVKQQGMIVTELRTKEGELEVLLMKENVTDFIYGDEKCFGIVQLEKGHGCAPAMKSTRAIEKFKEFIKKGTWKLDRRIDEILKSITLASNNGILYCHFNDYEHFADCLLSDNIESCDIGWTTSENIEDENVNEVLSNIPSDGTILCQLLVKMPIRMLKNPNGAFQYETKKDRCLLNRYLRIDTSLNVDESTLSFCE